MMALETAALFVVIETLVGQFLEPLIYGHSTGLSPISVVVAAIFWTWLWGPIGLILSTPLTLCLVILGRHVPRLEFLDVILGDRPALTPVENFYQRMLANDPDEALDQAELLLKERSLTAYYDEIALKGLQLAVNDAQRGALTGDQVDRIKNSIRSLVRDLADHDDRDPRPEEEAAAAETASHAERAIAKPSAPADAPEQLAPAWRTEAPVLCLAGRGTLDEAATAMLAQLLTKHNLGSRVAPHQAASREYISALDVESVAMVCISYFPVEVHQPDPGPLEIAQRVLAPVLNPLQTTLIVLIVSIFILLQREDLRDRLIRLFGANDLHRTTTALDEAAHRLSRYFLSQLAINTAFGIVIGLGLFLIGVPSPVLWGILGALLRFVPYIGSAIAAILPVALAGGVSPGWMMALETAALFVVIETLVGQFLEPLIYGHSTGLSPISVVVAAVF